MDLGSDAFDERPQTGPTWPWVSRHARPASDDRLKKALRTAAQSWADADVISKSAANLFVDLAGGIEACSYAYGGEDANRVKALADEVADLVRACVAFP